MSRQVDSLAASTLSALVIGATGTGKNVVARELHARSPRSSGPFITVTCAGLSDALLESQLFGHRRGAFAGALHDHDGAFRLGRGGTVFIDRIDQMPLPLQARLSSTFRTGQVTPLGGTHALPSDARVVCAANRDIEPLVRARE